MHIELDEDELERIPTYTCRASILYPPDFSLQQIRNPSHRMKDIAPSTNASTMPEKKKQIVGSPSPPSQRKTSCRRSCRNNHPFIHPYSTFLFFETVSSVASESLLAPLFPFPLTFFPPPVVPSTLSPSSSIPFFPVSFSVPI